VVAGAGRRRGAEQLPLPTVPRRCGMSASAIINMVIVLIIVVGGFAGLLAVALHKENGKAGK
jgi:hypothetical protein